MNPPIFHDTYRGPRYTYGLTYRPVARFNIPDGWIIGSQGQHPNFKNFGTIDYPARLSDQEARRYELVLVGEPAEEAIRSRLQDDPAACWNDLEGGKDSRYFANLYDIMEIGIN